MWNISDEFTLSLTFSHKKQYYWAEMVKKKTYVFVISENRPFQNKTRTTVGKDPPQSKPVGPVWLNSCTISVSVCDTNIDEYYCSCMMFYSLVSSYNDLWPFDLCPRWPLCRAEPSFTTWAAGAVASTCHWTSVWLRLIKIISAPKPKSDCFILKSRIFTLHGLYPYINNTRQHPVHKSNQCVKLNSPCLFVYYATSTGAVMGIEPSTLGGLWLRLIGHIHRSNRPARCGSAVSRTSIIGAASVNLSVFSLKIIPLIRSATPRFSRPPEELALVSRS